MRRGKEILEFLRSMPGGASTGEIAEGLRIRPTCAGKIIRELELAGEVFRCSGRWINTAAALGFNPNRVNAGRRKGSGVYTIEESYIQFWGGADEGIEEPPP